MIRKRFLFNDVPHCPSQKLVIALLSKALHRDYAMKTESKRLADAYI